MRLWQKMTLILLILSLIYASSTPRTTAAQPTSQIVNAEVEAARARLEEAYNATVTAEKIGANVNAAVRKLNYALDYINQAEESIIKGDLVQASALINASLQLSEETISLAAELKKQAEAQNFTRLVVSVAAVIVLAGLAVFAIFRGRRTIKKRRENRFMEMKVKKSNSTATIPTQEKDSRRDVDEEKLVIVAVLSALIVVAGLVVYASLTPPYRESFVSVYVLNSDKKAENYPNLLVLNKNNTFFLWVGVENFMGRTEYGVVEVKITNESLQNAPLPIEQVMRFEKILLNQETWEFPIIMTLDQIGEYKLTFELWLYNEKKAVFTLSNSWSDLRRLQVVAEA